MEGAATQRSSREPQAIRRGRTTDAVGGGAGVPRSRLSRARTEDKKIYGYGYNGTKRDTYNIIIF